MARREITEINAGSMADIAFLLLIFFLVTTTMDTDGGLTRKLPPMPEEIIDNPEVHKRDVLEILVNSNNQLLVEGQLLLVTELREVAKEHIVSDPNNVNMPAFKATDLPYFGTGYMVSKQIISLQNDRGTSYEMYIKVQNELVAAYSEVRNALAMERFGTPYADLPNDKVKAVRKVYPQRISEAEPKSIGN